MVRCCYCRVTRNGKGSWFKVDGKRMRRDIGLVVWEVRLITLDFVPLFRFNHNLSELEVR